jgi:threonine/homoserine/homoserine lactone efflux protein
MAPDDVLAFAAITIPLVLTPGIATTLVLRTSLLHGIGAGLVIAVGAALGSVAYGVLSGTSTMLLTRSWPGAVLALEISGGAYLLWLGGKAVWHALRRDAALPHTIARGGVGQGFLANALNPPVALFYLLVVPRFVPAGAPLFRSVMVLTGVHVGLAFAWHASCATAAGALSHLLTSPAVRRAIDLTTGAVLIAFALRMLL